MTVDEWRRKNPPIQRKPMTNADRIRQMSDKELAEWFDLHASEPLWCVLPECPDHEECVKCILDWLKSPCTDFIENKIIKKENTND